MFKNIKKLYLLIMLILFMFGSSVQADGCGGQADECGAYKFTIVNKGGQADECGVYKFTMVNKSIKIYISNRDSKKDEELIGAVLKITDQNGQVVNDLNGMPLEWITDGTVKEIHIPAGTYILEESIAPLGYKMSDKKIVFTVSEDGIVTSEVGFLIKKRKTYDNNLIVFENVQESRQVPTGSYVLYISLNVAFIFLGFISFIVIKRTKK